MPDPCPTYATEVNRTRPDYVVYRPSGEFERDSENQQIIVTPTPRGTFLATWTMSTHENHPDQRIVVSRSGDRGRTWSAPVVIDGASASDRPGTGLASWSFFIQAPDLGRIYLFCNKNIGITDCRDDTTGILRFRYSEDDGRTWSEPFDHLRIGRGALDHPDPAVPVNWVACFQSFLNADGVPMEGWTRWGTGSPNLLNIDSEVWFWRFDNILTETDPSQIRMTTLPDAPNGLRVASRDAPSISVAQEPATVRLPDGRLLTAMRTLNGYLAYSIGTGDGAEWSDPEPLRYQDGGELVLNPISPAPLYETGDGGYFLLFNNNDGTSFGGTNPTDYRRNRRPSWIAAATYAPDDHQPLRFGTPRLLCDTDGVVLGPSRRVEPASYPSYFMDGEDRFLWYPDRKHFVLGKRLSARLLSPTGANGSR
ncbi:exo-alpha-sialidase [Candidatus Poribacteria bacterium]|nr:exo-alpha-sialidase [Candidatus Poribacteria bacterium]